MAAARLPSFLDDDILGFPGCIAEKKENVRKGACVTEVGARSASVEARTRESRARFRSRSNGGIILKFTIDFSYYRLFYLA